MIAWKEQLLTVANYDTLISQDYNKLLEELDDVNNYIDDHCTLLHLECGFADIDAVKFLLSLSNIDVNKKDKNGYTPLHQALMNNHDYDKDDSKKLEIVRLLLEAGADPNILDNDYMNVLHLLCYLSYENTSDNYVEIYKLLRKFGAKIDTYDIHQLRPIHVVKCEKLAELLIKDGADIFEETLLGFNAYDFANKNKRTKILEVFDKSLF